MEIEVIGCAGAPAPGHLPMTLLVNGTVLVDAGSAASGLEAERAKGVTSVLLSHAHLDHIRELGFIPFRRDAERDGLFEIVGTEAVIRAVRTAVFNEAHWIDFEKPPAPWKPGIRYREIVPEYVKDYVSINQYMT